MKHMKYIIGLLIIEAVSSSCKRKSFDEYLFEEAKKYTESTCPKEIDKTTTIDSMVYDMKTRTLNYYYSLYGTLNDKETLTQSVIEDYTETLLITLRDDISLKKQKEDSINFSYHYHFTPNHEEAFRIDFGPKDYFGKLNVHTFNYREVRNLREFNRRNCPMRQDSCTVLDSMWYDSISRTYYYDYSLNGMLDDDSIYGKRIQKTLKKSLIEGLKENNEITNERDKEKLDFSFRYFSASTKKLLIESLIKNEEIK